MTSRAEQIRALEAWLAKNRPWWEQAKALADDPDAHGALRDDVLGRLREVLTSGPSRSPHYILGQAREALRPLERIDEILDSWKRKSDDLAKVNADAEASRLSSGGESDRPIAVNPDDTLI